MTRVQLHKLREHAIKASLELGECHKITRNTGLLNELTCMGIQSVAVLETALDSMQGRNELSRGRELPA